MYETVKQGVEREAMEEVGMIINGGAVDCMGLIVAKEPLVSQVHVGLVLVVEAQGTVVSQEDSQKDLRWMTCEELKAIPEDKQEGWTRVLVPEMQAFLESC